MSARDLEGEVRELRARIATLVDEAGTNERLLKRSQERELELLKAENLAQTVRCDQRRAQGIVRAGFGDAVAARSAARDPPSA